MNDAAVVSGLMRAEHVFGFEHDQGKLRSRSRAIAVARPTIPPPMMATS